MLVDMHTHILPEMDDGADCIETSLKMLDMLEYDGVTDVVLTPHFYIRNQNINYFLKRREEAYQKLLSEYKGRIRLHLGAEVEFSNISMDYREFKRLSIDGGRYILLELPFGERFSEDILQKIESFTYQTGLIPIIAHIERYETVWKNPEFILKLIAVGCLIQINADTISECEEGDLAYALLSHGQAHLIGTDCHNLDSRKPQYYKALSKLDSKFGKEYKNDMLSIAKRVMEGDVVYPYITDKIKKRFRKYK